MSIDLAQEAWTTPDRWYMWDFEQKPFSIKWLGTGTLSSPECKLYHNGSDVTSTYMTSGSDSVSGRVQTSKSVVSPVGGELYVLRWKVTEGGQVRGVQTELMVLAAGSER